MVIGSAAASTTAQKFVPLALRSTPFNHFVAPDAVDADAADATLEWLESVDHWIEKIGPEFHHHFYELPLNAAALPPAASLVFPAYCEQVRANCSSAFGVELGRVTVSVHKMPPGSRIRLHTDHGTDDVTHRFVVHLTRQWDAANGGLLLFLDADHRDEIHEDHRYYLPQHRLGVGFEVTPRSYHAVSEVLAGTRYTLCYSLTPSGSSAVK